MSQRIQGAVLGVVALSFLISLPDCAPHESEAALPEEIGVYQEFLQGKRPWRIEGEEVFLPQEWFEGDGSIEYTYLDLNRDGEYELLFYPRPLGSLNVAYRRGNDVLGVSTPFYSAANGEYISTNYEVTMVDTLHQGREDYSVFRLNVNNEMEPVVFFTRSSYDEIHCYKADNPDGDGLLEITEDEFIELQGRYLEDLMDLHWKILETPPDEEAFRDDILFLAETE